MKIESKDIRPGDVLIFKGQGFLYTWLSWLLKLINPSWDRWGWHMAVVVWWNGKDWIVLEATWPEVCLTPLMEMGEFRVYRWFEVQPDYKPIADFVKDNLGKRYDVLLYPWTAVQYLFRHFWNRPVPRLLDDQFTCWELFCEFAEAMGKPIVSKYDCPILPDIQKALEK